MKQTSISITVIAAISILAIIYMAQLFSQGVQARSEFERLTRPKFETACREQTGVPYTTLNGKTPNGTWKIQCGEGQNKQEITVSQ